MKPIIIKTLFLLLWIVSPSFGGVAVDSLNPKQFIQLFTRSREGMEPTNSDALIGYIRPSTNVWISFDKEMMKKCIHPKENNFKELGHLNDSLNSIRKKRDDLQAAALAQNDMAKAEELGRVYKEKIDSILTKIEHLGMWSTEISITIIARLTLHSGTMYDLPIPNYASGKDSQYTSLAVRKYKINDAGILEDGVVDAEIDLNSQKLSDGDVLDLLIDNNGEGLQRRYIKRFIISNYGWNVEFPPSLIFVKRTNETLDSLGKPVNPSNFKPAAGGSLLISYTPMEGIGEKLWKGFGIGINASLVDFERDKDFELGIGLIVYWLNRSVGFGYGWDIHASTGSTLFCPERSYYFLSLDFLKAFDTFSGFMSPTSSAPK